MLALPVIGGFLAATRLDISRYKVARAREDRLYFKIVYYALILSAAALVVVQSTWAGAALLGAGSVDGTLPSELFWDAFYGWASTIKDHMWAGAIVAFGLGHVSPRIFNSEAVRKRSIAIAIEDQELENMLATAYEEKKPILITLDTNKVYLGWPVKGPNPEVEQRWVRILPWASGYRNETQSVKFTTDYTAIIDRISSNDQALVRQFGGRLPEVSDFEVILPIECIVSAHLFDIRTYELFDSAGASLFAKPNPPPATAPSPNEPEPAPSPEDSASSSSS
jgi:hypothetical protein